MDNLPRGRLVLQASCSSVLEEQPGYVSICTCALKAIIAESLIIKFHEQSSVTPSVGNFFFNF